MLKNYRRLLMVIAVLAAGTLVFKIWPRRPKYIRPHSPSKEIVQSLLGSPVDLGAPTIAKINSVKKTAVEPSAADKKCVAEAMDIARMSTVRVVDLVMTGKQELKICGPAHAHLKELVEKIKAECIDKPNLTDIQKQECKANIGLYRASLVDELTNGADLTQLSESALLNKAFAIFNEGLWKDKEQGPVVVGRTDQVANELLRRRPDWDFAQKLKVIARMLTGDAKGMAAIAMKARQIHPEDADFLEASFFSTMQTSPDKLMADVDAHIRQFPDDPIGHYWKAAAYSLQHDEKNAKTEVEQAKWLDPDNARYRDTLNKLSNANDGSAFSVQIKLPFDDMD